MKIFYAFYYINNPFQNTKKGNCEVSVSQNLTDTNKEEWAGKRQPNFISYFLSLRFS